MNYLKTTKGLLPYKQRILDLESLQINDEEMTNCFRQIYFHLEKLGVNWGPSFITLFGFVKGNGFGLCSSPPCIYVLKKDEERLKEGLWDIVNDGFVLCRYDRRGMYYLQWHSQYLRIEIFHKISSNFRYAVASNFVHEKFFQNIIKLEFRGMLLTVPSDLDEYLSLQYGNSLATIRTGRIPHSYYQKFKIFSTQFITDYIPNACYFRWMYHKRKVDYDRFKKYCSKNDQSSLEGDELYCIKPRKHKIVLTFGVYDLIHKGHVELFRRAKGLGDYLIVAVQNGDWVKKYKDTELLNSTEDRCLMVRSIRYVDEVVIYSSVDESIMDIEFDLLVTGPDQSHTGFQRAVRWCEKNGKEHVVLGRTLGVSSSELKEKMVSKISANQ